MNFNSNLWDSRRRDTAINCFRFLLSMFFFYSGFFFFFSFCKCKIPHIHCLENCWKPHGPFTKQNLLLNAKMFRFLFHWVDQSHTHLVWCWRSHWLLEISSLIFFILPRFTLFTCEMSDYLHWKCVKALMPSLPN